MPRVRLHDATDPDLEWRLRRWTGASLISTEEAAAIRAFEAQGRRPAARIPPVAEVIGYLGAALAVAAGGVVLARVWNDLSAGGRLAIVASATLLVFVAGLLLRRSDEPAFERLRGVLWFLAVGGAAWSAGLLAADVLEVSSRTVPIWVGGAMTVSGAVVYALQRRALQALALTAGVLTLLTGSWQSPVPTALSWWVVGAAWMVLGWRGALDPDEAFVRLGSIVAAIGPALMVADAPAGAYALGLATAGGLLVASVVLREPMLLVPGGLALFAYLLSAIQRYLGDTLGMPVVLLIAGVALLATALVAARLLTLSRKGGPPR